jgi:hypothetical protein
MSLWRSAFLADNRERLDADQKRKKLRKSRVVAPCPTGIAFGRLAYCGHIAWIMRETKIPPLPRSADVR